MRDPKGERQSCVAKRVSNLSYNLEKYTESKSSVSDVEWLKTRTLKLNDGFIKFECSGRDKKIRIAITYALNDATELKL